MKSLFPLILFFSLLLMIRNVSGQEPVPVNIAIDPAQTYQVMEGFGASLAYYENWLIAHPNKAEIYEAIFGELSLDILRLRNAYDYDATMVTRAKEFVDAAENSLGHPITVLSTSWGPPGYLKSNGDRTNGGTLRFTSAGDSIQFDYAGFAHWWKNSLKEYHASGVYPKYISIQNEPRWTATWETCRFEPSELVSSSDTIAGYDRALDAVFDSVAGMDHRPLLLGPETIGIGYNTVESFGNEMDLSKIYGIAHHLYHGVDEDNPYASANFSKVGNYHPEIPHFQTEYSRGDWWSLAGLIYKSLHDEHVVAYLYWDLIWTGSGLVDLDFPWDRSRWKDRTKGYTRTKDFYSFKQYAAFIHPGWTLVGSSVDHASCRTVTFFSPDKDSAATVVINLSLTEHLRIFPQINGLLTQNQELFVTSESKNCSSDGTVPGIPFTLAPKSIATLTYRLADSTEIVLADSVTILVDQDQIFERYGQLNIRAEIFPEQATCRRLYWEITDGQEIAAIDQEGVLAALGSGDGTVTVLVSTVDGSGKSATVRVRLNNQVWVESIELSASDIEIDTYQGTALVSAAVLPGNASNKKLAWELAESDTIASIDSTGLVTALGNGEGTVTVTASATDSSDISDSISIVITNQATGIREGGHSTIRIWSSGRIIHFDRTKELERTLQILCYSSDGRLLIKQTVKPFTPRGVITMERFPAGTYLVRVTCAETTKTKLVILE